MGAALLREMIARPSAAYQSVQAAKLGIDKPGGEFRAALEEAVLGDCSLVGPDPARRTQRGCLDRAEGQGILALTRSLS